MKSALLFLVALVNSCGWLCTSECQCDEGPYAATFHLTFRSPNNPIYNSIKVKCLGDSLDTLITPKKEERDSMNLVSYFWSRSKFPDSIIISIEREGNAIFADTVVTKQEIITNFEISTEKSAYCDSNTVNVQIDAKNSVLICKHERKFSCP